MVSYQRFVGIVADATTGETFTDATERMSWTAERWTNNKDRLERATVAEARQLVQRSL